MRQRRVLFFCVVFSHKRSMCDLYKAIIYFYTHLPISLPAGRTYVICREFKKISHHLTFLFKMPLFTKVPESEVFAKHLTQHLTQQVTFSPRTLAFIRFPVVMCSGKE